jgi:hypothetical protein
MLWCFLPLFSWGWLSIGTKNLFFCSWHLLDILWVPTGYHGKTFQPTFRKMKQRKEVLQLLVYVWWIYNLNLGLSMPNSQLSDMCNNHESVLFFSINFVTIILGFFFLTNWTMLWDNHILQTVNYEYYITLHRITMSNKKQEGNPCLTGPIVRQLNNIGHGLFSF